MPPPLPLEEEAVPPVFIQSDIGLHNGVGAHNDAAAEEEQEQLGASGDSLGDDNEDDDDGDDEDIINGVDTAPVANMDLDDASPAPAPASNGRKRGRPSLSASNSRNGTPKTPSKSTFTKTPRTAKSTAASKATPSTTGAKRGRKRKADEGDATAAAPAAKKARAPRAIREEREPTRAISKRGAAVAAKETFATALKAKITKVEAPAPPAKGGKRRGRKPAAAAKAVDQDWEVEEIIDAGVVGPNGKPKTYLVKWKGYSADENTWEPRKNLSGCAGLLKAFDEKNQPEGAATEKKTRGRKPGVKGGPKAAAEKPAPAVGPPEKKVPRKPPTARKLAPPKKATVPGRRGRPAKK